MGTNIVKALKGVNEIDLASELKTIINAKFSLNDKKDLELIQKIWDNRRYYENK